MNDMERKIGEIFEYKGEWYQCVEDIEDISCVNCCFYNGGLKLCTDEDMGACVKEYRSDAKSICFKKLEKVREPYMLYGKLVQKYRFFHSPAIQVKEMSIMKTIRTDNTIEIEINQTKEDMEEKGQCGDNRFEIIAKAKEALLNETNIARDEQEMAVIDNILFRCWQMGWLDKYDDTKHSNSEKIGKNLRPFDLEAAKLGKPVCTRDGRKARIICFDRNAAEYHIVALIGCKGFPNKEEEIKVYNNAGKYFANGESSHDLMMLPEKKEGWVNIYHDKEGNIYTDENVYNTEKDAINFCPHDKCRVATVKVEWEE